MVLINHQLKALYIHIPKVAGCFVEIILQEIYGFQDIKFEDINSNQQGILGKSMLLGNYGTRGFYKSIIQHSTDAKNYDLSTYFKFTFVRSPYTRFISAYKYLSRYYEKHEKNTKGTFPNLESFIEDHCKKQKLPHFYWLHVLTTQIQHIEDEYGYINIDFIGRFENLNEDLCYIITQIFKLKIHFRHILEIGFRRNRNPIDENYSEYYNEHVLNFVNTYYNREFNVFNYQMVDNIEQLNTIIQKNEKPNNESLIQKIENISMFGEDKSRRLKILFVNKKS